MADPVLQNGPVLLPMNLDAFVLNKPACDTEGSKVLIAPITQPDYVGLRLDNSVIQHDILPPVDLHASRPAFLNPRISKAYSTQLNTVKINNPQPDFSTNADGTINEARLGIYLHWSLPRGYRSGTSAASGAERNDPDDPALQPGADPNLVPNNIAAPSNPKFRLTPNRFLVVRKLKEQSPPEANLPALDAWIIESDRLRTVDSDDLSNADLETEVTPYVVYDTKAPPGNLLHSQAEKYIGFRSKSLFSNVYSETVSDRVPLSVMNSSNPLFADYTIHNPNVFSMKDNLEYGTAGKHLQHALCDYVVIGWHSTFDDGPLGANGLLGGLRGRLESFFCNLADGTPDLWQNSRAKIAILSHGVIYDVLYDAGTRPVTPADQYARNFTDKVDMEPIAVGATPLDSVLTFLQAHKNDNDIEEGLLGTGASNTANTLLDLAELLYATGEDYDARIKASDLIQGQRFSTALGGFSWHYDRKKDGNGPPQAPSTTKNLAISTDPRTQLSELDILNRLNEYQQQLDITDRMIAVGRWGLFAEFFKYCSDANNGNPVRKQSYLGKLLDLYGRDAMDPKAQKSILQSLLDTKAALEKNIGDIVTPSPPQTPSLIPVKKVAGQAFKQRTDPTLLIAGMDSGWPEAFLDTLQIRFGNEVKAPASLAPLPSSSPPVDTLITKLLGNLNLPPSSGSIKDTISKLLLEANDAAKPVKNGFKPWAGQPFCPIFVEWEGVFYNVDASQWSIGLGSSPMSSNNQQQIRYINPTPLHEPAALLDQDTRAVSGRILVLPQPSFALAAVVKQVLDVAGVNVPVSLQGTTKDSKGKLIPDGKLDQAKLDTFVKKVEKLPFISGDLLGFTDALLTMATGSHVKPNVRVPGGGNTPLQEAIDVGVQKMGVTDSNLMRDIIAQMDSQTAKTPFGTLADFDGVKFQPFKPVQHGQLVLTNLKIIDKFGQAIACPLPKRKPRTPPPVPEFPIHPCLADQMCPTLLKGNVLNTVFTNTDALTSSKMVQSPFIQITPAINQTARMNAAFLQRKLDDSRKPLSPPWKTCNDWDNPMFGWIIVNYADSSLQFFTGEGIFYTSLRFGGPTGTITGLQWAPFASPPPDTAGKLVSQQLIDLIAKMQPSPTNPTEKAQEYLRAMWGMINGAIGSMPFPPSQYSAYANAIVGKPLALVNVGWSLELAEAPKKAQHTLGQQPEAGYEEKMMYSYNFPVKIGDFQRPFDGVVCYWDTDDNLETSTGKTAYDTMYTYPYPSTDSETAEQEKIDPRIMIEPHNFPTLTPYFIDPTTVESTKGLLNMQAEQFKVKTLLIDPYTPLHLYSAILPIRSLKLPGWSLEAAMRNMTAFFTLGPMLLTKDVPKQYDVRSPLMSDTWLAKQASDDPTKKKDAYPIKLPIAGGKGTWNWLQPYKDPAPAIVGTPPRPLYNSLEVGNESGSFRDDPAPYTFVEGFLQLARPLIDAAQVNAPVL